MFKGLFLFFFILNAICYAQTGGEEAFLILNTNSSARQTALGGKVLTLLDNVNQPTTNPATINLDIDKRLAVNYTSYIGGINIGSASYAKRFNRRTNVFHTNLSYINYGSFIEADIDGNETGTFNASDLVVSIGYATRILKTRFYAGANLKYITSSIAGYTASGIAADLGLIYYHKSKPYVATLVIRNIGTQISTFTGTTEKLPFEVALGASYRLDNVPLRWYLTLENLQKWNVAIANPSNATTDLNGNVTNENISFLNNAFRHVIIGAELFPESAINLRVGYNIRRGRELQLQNLRSFGGLSFGFGLKMNKIKLNYAYSKFLLDTNINTFSLEIDLNRKARVRIPKSY